MDYNRVLTRRLSSERTYLTTKAKSGHGDFARSIRGAVHGLWAGIIDSIAFTDIMQAAITRGLTRAWYEGAQECGIQPDELTLSERAELLAHLSTEVGFIAEFATAIQDGSKANNQKLTPLLHRAKLWVNRFTDVKNHARLLACKDQKMKWELGATEKHCRTCAALDGKVKRASIWTQAAVRPQNPPNNLLECQGWRCDCSLTTTTEPLSKGPLPNLP